MFETIQHELENSNATPLDQIYSREFVEGLLKCGSLISIIENKKLNTTMLFSLLLENPNYQDFFTEITSSENFKEAILSLLYIFPALVKSKITKSVIRKLNAKQAHKTRTAHLQHPLGSLKKPKKQTIPSKKRLRGHR
jgi:hypothetical protein